MRLEFKPRTLVAIVADPEREVTAWDTLVPGLALRVSKRGVKTFAFKYRHNGRQTFIKLGRLGELTIDEARRKALECRRQVTEGTDPQTVRREHREALTVAQGLERMLSEHTPRLRTSTSHAYTRVAKNVIAPAIGSVALRDLAPQHVAAMHHGQRHYPAEANTALVVLSMLCRYAERWGEIPLGANPCQHQRRYPSVARHRYLTPDELTAVGVSIDALDGNIGSAFADCLRLLILTGARKSEMRCLRWEQVDLDGRRILLDPSEHKTGGTTHAKQIPLGEAAVALLTERRAAADADDVSVFPSAREGIPIGNLDRAWQRVRAHASRDGIDVTDVHIHDLRHTWGAMATSGGHALQTIGAVMGHRNASTTARYAHVAPSPAALAVEDTSARIAAALGGGKKRKGRK